MRSLILVVLIIVMMGSPLWGQTPGSDDDHIDALLASSGLSWGQAAWLVGRSVGILEEFTDFEQSSRQALNLGWGSPELESETPVDLAVYCELLMKSHKISGGIFYTLFPGPRYAYRELAFKKIIPPRIPPDGMVSGQQALLFLQNLRSHQENPQ